MADVDAYEASTVDWGRIRSYAARVARETTVPMDEPIVYHASGSDREVEAIGRHWLLHAREHHLEEPFETGAETSHVYYYVVLLPDGSLQTVEVDVEEDLRSNFSLTSTRHTYERKHSVKDLDDGAIAWFDFEKPYYEHEPTSPEDWKRYWGNLYGEPGKPIVDTKGEGILRALEGLLCGTPRQQLTTPHYFDAPNSIPPPTPSSITAGSGYSRINGARRTERQAEQRLRAGDLFAAKAAVFLAVTVLGPFLIGHFLLRKTFVLNPDPGVYAEEARGIWDHLLATYMAGLVPIALALGIFLVARRPWQNRVVGVVCGWVALVGSILILLPIAMSEWHKAEQTTITKLRETAFPFHDKYLNCASWNFGAENGAQQPELWQVHLGRTLGTSVDGCNRVNVYRGWQFVGAFDLPDGDIFTAAITVNHVGWDRPYQTQGSGDISSVDRETGSQFPMNPIATNVDLPTANGRVLAFSLDGAAAGRFELR
jgi:hypothetical protein